MSASPEFPPSLFHVVLSYLLPPTPPLPPHLLSKALTQRHHFLNILPESGPAAYFIWPKPGSAGSGSVVDALSQISEKPDEVPIGDIEYEAYGDSFHARVGIRNDLQLVFILEVAPDGSMAEWKYFDVVWRSKVPKGKPSMQALLDSTGPVINDEDQEMDADVEDLRKAAKEFWGDNWGDANNAEDAAIASDSDDDLNDEVDAKYYSRYDNVDTVIDDMARTTLSGSSISDSSNLPQIPTEGHNSPYRGNSNAGGPDKVDHTRTPLVKSAQLVAFPSGDEAHLSSNGLSVEDAAAMEVIRGAYRLWSRGARPGHQVAFLALVERALSSLE